MLLLLLLLHSEHHSQTQNGRVLLHCAEALLYCMSGSRWDNSLLIRNLFAWLCNTLQQHNTDQMKAWKYLFFFYAGTPQRGCSSYRCGSRHHISPLDRERKENCSGFNSKTEDITGFFPFFYKSMDPQQKKSANIAVAHMRKGNVASMTPWS